MKVFKSMSQLVLITMMLSFHQVAFAYDGLRFVQGQQGPNFTLHYEGPANQQLVIRIIDQNGQSVFDETMQSTSHVAKKYNLRNLPEGKYTVKVSDVTRIRIQPIYLLENAVQIDTQAMRTIYKPQIKYHDQLLDINMLSNDELVEIQVRNDLGEVLYQNKYPNATSIHQRYNLSQLRHGKYLLVIKNGEDNYYQEISR